MRNSIHSFGELLEEFDVLFATKPHLDRLKTVFDEIETKYRSIKKLQENIANKLFDADDGDDRLKDIEIAGSKVKNDYVQLAQKYATYQK